MYKPKNITTSLKPKGTLAALVLARDHLEITVSGFSTLKNDTELLLRAAKSNAFHLEKPKQNKYQKTKNFDLKIK